MTIISREQAKELGYSKYFIGRPCKHNHIDEVYVSTGVCCTCKRNYALKERKSKPEKLKILRHKKYIRNKDKIRASNISWAGRNKDKMNMYKNNWKLRNKIKYAKYLKSYNKRKSQDPFYRLSRNTSKALWAFLKGCKGYRKWEDILGYNAKQLSTHLQSKFDSKMTWSNYGSYWRVDHIIPLNHFINMDIPITEKIKLAWDIKNLQPLEGGENSRKSDRLPVSYTSSSSNNSLVILRSAV